MSFVHRLLSIFAIGMVAISAHAASVVLNTTSSNSVTATITPDANEIGKSVNVWMGALYQGVLFLRSGTTWTPYRTGSLPVAISGQTLSTSTPVTVVDQLDISGLRGLDIYVGYGTSEQTMLSSTGHLAKIYSVPLTKPQIASISICKASSGPIASGGCPSGSVDSLQAVIAPASQGGGVIDNYGGLFGISDEHVTILPPGTFPSHANDYLVMAASDTKLGQGDGAGLVVLTAGAGPDANGQWTLDFAHEYGLYKPTNSIGSQNGQLFLAAMGHGNCPVVSNFALQDPTFDINYAAPGSVVIDPTNPNNSGPGNVLMIYEGTTYCFGVSGSGVSGNFYSTIGIATSLDHGVTWPTYRNNWVPLPGTNPTLGPNAPYGALGSKVCMGNDCTTTPPVNYGRYAVLSQPVTVPTIMSLGQPLGNTVGNNMGNSEPSAFVDDMKATANPYLYIVSRYMTGPTDLGGFHFDTSAVTGGIGVARAQLNGGSAPLQFTKWFGPTVNYTNGTASGSFVEQTPSVLPTGVTCSAATCPPYPSNKGMGNTGGGLESPIFPTNPKGGSNSASYKTCQGSGQVQWMPSISYVEATQDYLLIFVCLSPSDPGTQTGTAGAAWFYSTLDATQYDLSRQDKWSVPQEIIGSWSSYDSTFQCGATSTFQNYAGWYPSLMSLGLKPGHLSSNGYIFFLKGCAGGGPGRQFSSRAFTISTY
jgi:hypothetical protein